MSEESKEYTLISKSGKETKVVFTHRYCGCSLPGCVDDEIKVYIDGPDNPGYGVQVYRGITPFIEGLFDGSYVVKNKGIELGD